MAMLAQLPYVEELHEKTTKAGEKTLLEAYKLYSLFFKKPEVTAGLKANRFTALLSALSSKDAFVNSATSAHFRMEVDPESPEDTLWEVHSELAIDGRLVLATGPKNITLQFERKSDGAAVEVVEYRNGTLSFKRGGSGNFA